MPLDTSTYSLALLRLDGRRWNELRRLTAQISTQASADGSSYLEMGNTKVICTVMGPSEQKPAAGTGGRGVSGNRDEAEIRVEISVAGFSGVDRKRRVRNDKCVYFLSPKRMTDSECNNCRQAYVNYVFEQAYRRNANHHSVSIRKDIVHEPLPTLHNHSLLTRPISRRLPPLRAPECLDTRPDRRRYPNARLHLCLYRRFDFFLLLE